MRRIALTSLLLFVVFFNSIQLSSQSDRTPSNQGIPETNEPPPVQRRRPGTAHRQRRPNLSQISNARTPASRDERRPENILIPNFADVMSRRYPRLFLESSPNSRHSQGSHENSPSPRSFGPLTPQESYSRYHAPPIRSPSGVNVPAHPQGPQQGPQEEPREPHSPPGSSTGSTSDNEP